MPHTSSTHRSLQLSQLFASKLCDPLAAQALIVEHGWENTKGIMYLCMQSQVDMSWIEFVRNNPPTAETALQGLMMILAHRGEWEDKKHMTEALLNCVSDKQLIEHHIMHCVAWTGQTSALMMLEKRLPQFDWNSTNDLQLTPLALALSEMHLNTSVYLRKKGACLDQKIADGKSVLSWVMLRHAGDQKSFKEFLAAVDDSFHLQEAVQTTLNKKPRKTKKSKI